MGTGRTEDYHAQRGLGQPTSVGGGTGAGIGSVPWSALEEALERCGSKGRLGSVSRHLYGGSECKSHLSRQTSARPNKICGAAALVI